MHTVSRFVVMLLIAADEPFDSMHLQNWHQWRGPLATGVAPLGDPPIRWDERTNVKWKVALAGLGSATPIVWGDQVFVLSAAPIDRKPDQAPANDSRAKTTPDGRYHQFIVESFDRQSGALRWKQIACEAVPHEGRHDTNTYASASPITDGRRLYVSFGSRGIFCYSLEGTLKWQRDLGRMRTRYGWGEGASPAIGQGRLFVNWDHEDQSFLVALHSETGEIDWKVTRDEPTSWATPLVVSHAGRLQLVVNATKRVRGYESSTGRLLWECGGQTTNVIASPIAADGIVYCMSNYGESAALAIPLDAVGDISNTDRLLWSHSRGTPYVPSPLLYDGRLYFLRANSNVLTCLDAKSGRPLTDQVRITELGSIYASPAAAAGRLYLADRAGTVCVLQHGQSDVVILATNRLGDSFDASPAIVGNQIFLRGRQFLYCITSD